MTSLNRTIFPRLEAILYIPSKSMESGIIGPINGRCVDFTIIYKIIPVHNTIAPQRKTPCHYENIYQRLGWRYHENYTSRYFLTL